MDRSQLPLNALRSFEAAARHLNFTRAAMELCVSQAALSHQIKSLEERLGIVLFQRLPRGVALTDEGAALVPALTHALDQISRTLDIFAGDVSTSGNAREILTVGVVSSFAVGWLLPRLKDFAIRHPEVEIRLKTNNNVAELAGEGLDCAIRYGNGRWTDLAASHVVDAPLTAMASPKLLAQYPNAKNWGAGDFTNQVLLRSYRSDEWPAWFAAMGAKAPTLTGPVFDNSLAIAGAAISGFGIGLLPAAVFKKELASERLAIVQPKQVSLGQYWLVRLPSRDVTPGLAAFEAWLKGQG